MKARAVILALLGLIVLGGLTVLPAPLVVGGQQPAKVPRVGLLLIGSASTSDPVRVAQAFRQGLSERGYVEGKNIAIEQRSAEGRFDRLPGLATGLVHLKVDVIVVGATPSALAARQATKTIPIVVAAMADPVRDGLVASLARPGGNITGFTFLARELVPKRLELLKEALPGVSRVAALWHPDAYGERTMRDMVKETEGAARALGVELRLLPVEGPGDFDGAFSAMTRERAGALMVFPSPKLYIEHRRVVDLVTKHRVPAFFAFREAVEAGGLMSYGADIPDLFRRAATHVDQILKGAKPGDLPIEQPTKFELVINLKTAKALGLTIPPSLVLRADQVIE